MILELMTLPTQIQAEKYLWCMKLKVKSDQELNIWKGAQEKFDENLNKCEECGNIGEEKCSSGDFCVSGFRKNSHRTDFYADSPSEHKPLKVE